jgi:hypothetical protein
MKALAWMKPKVIFHGRNRIIQDQSLQSLRGVILAILGLRALEP